MVSAVSPRDALILNHQGVAKSAALDVARRFHLPVDDLCQEAFVALIVAADSFDPTRGTQFSTWAVWVIRGKLKSAVEKERRHTHQLTFTALEPNAIGRTKHTYTPQRVERLDEFVEAASEYPRTRLDVIESPIPTPEDHFAGRELMEAAEHALETAMRTRGHLAAALALNRLAEKPQSAKRIAKRFGVGDHRVRSVDAEILALARSML